MNTTAQQFSSNVFSRGYIFLAVISAAVSILYSIAR
jgi:hypothetical protein